MKKAVLLSVFLVLFIFDGKSQIKNFCYTLSNGKYVLALYDDGTKKVSYDLYSNSGTLQKTVKGTWTLRDEGVYGPSYVLTVAWTGVNAGLPELKFNVVYDGYGNMQSLTDVTGRTWNNCR
jgi:hypothetical protein